MIYVKQGENKKCDDFIMAYHYSHKITLMPKYRFTVYEDDVFLGAVTIGLPINCKKTKIFFDEDVPYDSILELNRMCFIDNKPKNLESKVLSLCFKKVKNDYHKKNKKLIFIQSFADEICRKKGVVYQACSFEYYGSHENTFYYTPDGRENHAITLDVHWKIDKNLKKKKRTQYRYIFWFDRSYKKKMKLKQQPYPKEGKTELNK